MHDGGYRTETPEARQLDRTPCFHGGWVKDEESEDRREWVNGCDYLVCGRFKVQGVTV